MEKFQISNFKFQNNRAFTIIEILVVIAVVGILGVIITDIFFNTLKGNNKAALISKIKQNGQSAMEQMDKTIRNADGVVCVNTQTKDVLVVQKNGIYTRYAFIFPQNANGYISQDNPADEVSATCNVTDVPANSQNLTENTTIQLHKPVPPDTANMAEFAVNAEPGFRDVVSVTFSLKPGIGSSSSLQIDPIPFATTVELR